MRPELESDETRLRVRFNARNYTIIYNFEYAFTREALIKSLKCDVISIHWSYKMPSQTLS